MTAEAPAKRESWADWMPGIPATMTVAEFVRYTNAHLDTGVLITEADLETWQDDGLLPQPVEIPGGKRPRYGYPPIAWRLIADLLYPEVDDTDPDWLRQTLRSQAQAINNSPAARRQTWRDFMPVDAPMPALLSHDELLEALRERGIDLPSSTLEYYRQQGILPRPIRRRHGGATRPVYPEWMIEAIEYLRMLQDQGLSLEEIKPRMHVWMLGAAAGRETAYEKAVALEAAFRKVAIGVGNLRDLSAADKVTISITDDKGNEVYRHENTLTPD